MQTETEGRVKLPQLENSKDSWQPPEAAEESQGASLEPCKGGGNASVLTSGLQMCELISK